MSQKQSTCPPATGRRLDSRYLSLPFENENLRSIIGLAPIENLTCKPFNDLGVSVDVLRLDKLDDQLGGNKIFKLWGHLRSYFTAQQRPSALVSFGGAYSNHLYALAGLGQRIGIPTVGFIRGEQSVKLSPTLSDLSTIGMKLIFIDRQTYKRKTDKNVRRQLQFLHGIDPKAHWIPEGGGGEEGLIGSKVLGEWIANRALYSDVVLACGTGTTMAGIFSGIQHASEKGIVRPRLIGISALRSNRSIIDHLLRAEARQAKRHRRVDWVVSNQYHFGGFAKTTERLQRFMQFFYQETAIPTDRVYTAKTFFGLSDLVQRGVFSAGRRILVIHTGGLQGNRS